MSNLVLIHFVLTTCYYLSSKIQKKSGKIEFDISLIPTISTSASEQYKRCFKSCQTSSEHKAKYNIEKILHQVSIAGEIRYVIVQNNPLARQVHHQNYYPIKSRHIL